MTKRNLFTKTNDIQKKINKNTISSIDMKIADKIYQVLTIGSIRARKMFKGDIHNNP